MGVFCQLNVTQVKVEIGRQKKFNASRQVIDPKGIHKTFDFTDTSENNIWDKVFKKGPSKNCGRQPLKNFTWSILEYFLPFVFTLRDLRSFRSW